MLSADERQRGQFQPGDSVVFTYRRKHIEGMVLRLNPKRAVVKAGESRYSIAYARLIPTTGSGEARIQHLENIHSTASALLQQHGLKKWRFKFDHSTRRAGGCYYRDKVITLAIDLAASGSEEAVRDTVLHEIAHALVGRKHHHDAVWKTKAIEIGCSGERTHSMQFSIPRWSVTCENACWSHTAQRKNHRIICRKCGGQLVYSPFTPPA